MAANLLTKIFQKFVPKDLIDNILALIQIMAWHHTGGEPVSGLVYWRIYDSIGLNALRRSLDNNIFTMWYILMVIQLHTLNPGPDSLSGQCVNMDDDIGPVRLEF